MSLAPHLTMISKFPRKLAEWIGWSSADAVAGEGVAPRVETAVAKPSASEPLSQHDVGTAVELFSRLAEITAAVTSEVSHHSGNLQTVNEELRAIEHGDVSAVAAAVCKLLVLNQQTHQRLAQAELRLQAQQRQINDVAVASKTDALTGLLNRRGLDEELQRLITEFRVQGRPATIMLLDVDHFKRFNDTHGHLAGDQALKRLADVLLAHARGSDAVARFGGEEFAVVFPGAKSAAVVSRAEKMRYAISQTDVLIDGRALRITASMGMTEIFASDDPETLLKRADEALYAAKLDGRDSAYWHLGDRLQRLGPDAPELAPALSSDAPPPRAEAVALAAEQFADATFVTQLARRVAEWKRGGTTFSVSLVRVSFPPGETGPASESQQTVMRIVYQLARAVLRDMDLLTRWQDDGLAILLPGSLVTDGAGVAGRLRTAIERHDMPVAAGRVKLSIVAGVAEIIEGNDPQRVLRRAYQALESAQAAGSGQIHLHDGLRAVTAS
jgi:diguanylate cyclase (GGDEF)-like protein